MNFSHAIDLFIADWQTAGRINSPRTEVAYRSVLGRHADDVSNQDPRATGREDAKRTLQRWPNPNTQRCSRAVLCVFYDWTMEEGLRKDNPARQTRRPKAQPTSVYRLTATEAAAMLTAAHGGFERRAITLALCAGLRSAELRGLQGHHFDREGYVHVSEDIAKGGRGRWVPVIAELAGVAAEIRATVAREHYALTATWTGGGGWGSAKLSRTDPTRPASSQHLQRCVWRVAKRAGIRAHVHPHLLRHAFCDHVARHTGLAIAQALMGHADVRTTSHYTGAATLEELAAAVAELRFSHPSQDGPTSAKRRGRDSNPRRTPALEPREE